MDKIKVIINADDCGYDTHVNEHICNAIEKRRITSTTVMANMADLDGAARLYKAYKDSVSFGFHMNLTEGSPILYSQPLMDMGFYKEEDGKIVFNAQPFRRKLLSKGVREDIYKEILAQVESIMDKGVNLSHIDGHHFIHQAVFMLPLLPRLCREIGVHKVRNYRNYMPASFNRWARGQWIRLVKMRDDSIKTTDWFTGFEDFYKIEKEGTKYYQKYDTIELMCHPGGKYTNEEEILLNINIESGFNCELINYNQI